MGYRLNGELIWILSVLLIGISSIVGAVNFVTTIVWMRTPGMTFFRMPLFVWTVLSAQLLQLFCLLNSTHCTPQSSASTLIAANLEDPVNRYHSQTSDNDPLVAHG